MISLAAKVVGSPRGRKWLRLTAQTGVSVALIVYVVNMARHAKLAAAFNHLGLQPLILACACFGAAAVLSARRWQLLLRYQGIEECLARLTEVYAIGLFCNLFLPTAAGGDAFRVFDVARRQNATARVLVATLQERLIGLGAAMFGGLFAAVWFWDILPANLLAGAFVICCSGVLAVAMVLHIGLIVTFVQKFIIGRSMPAALARWLASPTAVRAAAFLAPLGRAKQLSVRRTIRVVCLALATFAMSVLMATVVCDALDVGCGPLALCLVMSLVGVVRMTPIALNGIGIGESAFVFLMGLFRVPGEKAAAVALALLGVQTAMSLVGGLLFLRRAVFGVAATAATDQTQPVLLAFPRRKSLSRGTKRHAA